MELLAILVGVGIVGLVALVAITIAIINLMPNNAPRRATPTERATNQAEIEEWISRTAPKNERSP